MPTGNPAIPREFYQDSSRSDLEAFRIQKNDPKARICKGCNGKGYYNDPCYGKEKCNACEGTGVEVA
jgi:hypothetical protein